MGDGTSFFRGSRSVTLENQPPGQRSELVNQTKMHCRRRLDAKAFDRGEIPNQQKGLACHTAKELFTCRSDRLGTIQPRLSFSEVSIINGHEDRALRNAMRRMLHPPPIRQPQPYCESIRQPPTWRESMGLALHPCLVIIKSQAIIIVSRTLEISVTSPDSPMEMLLMRI
ncbi:Uncharacterized protein HZ326_6755 [Fusarium oxysporum f. sp. albedinis]|nr:Uncharacterized protein HZ326_6755 [Fusarium oxysporum f. sp. albedinis]